MFQQQSRAVVGKEIYIDDLVQDCSNSSALAMELLQSCTKPLMSGPIVAVLLQLYPGLSAW